MLLPRQTCALHDGAQSMGAGFAISLLHAPAKPGSAKDHRARFSVTSTDISIEGDQVSLLAFANCSWMNPGSARPRIPCAIPLSSNVLATIQQATRTFMRVPISSHSAAAVQDERSRCSAREKKDSHPGSRRCTRCFYQTNPSLIQRTMAKRRPGREGQDERRKRRPLVTPYSCAGRNPGPCRPTTFGACDPGLLPSQEHVRGFAEVSLLGSTARAVCKHPAGRR